MKMRDATEAALKVLGVYCIVQGVFAIPALVIVLQARAHFASGAPEAQRIFMVRYQDVQLAMQLVQSALLAGGILLLLFARRVAGRLVSDDARLESPKCEFKIASPEGFQFCLKLIGIYALFRAVELLAQGVTGTLSEQGMENYGLRTPYLYRYLPGALVLALAIYLLRGGEWLTRFAWPQWDEGEEELEEDA